MSRFWYGFIAGMTFVALLVALAPKAHAAVERDDAGPVDPVMLALADGLATRYAAEQGWPDKCAGQAIDARLVRNLDAVAGQSVDGLASGDGSCSFAVDARVPKDPLNYCATVMHERLHLARGDGWHSTDPTSPLYGGGSDSSVDCAKAFPGGLTAQEARSAARPFVGARSVIVRTVENETYLDRTLKEWTVWHWDVIARLKGCHRARRCGWRRYSVLRKVAGQPPRVVVHGLRNF